MESINPIESIDHHRKTINKIKHPTLDTQSSPSSSTITTSMLSSSKSATLITCSSSFTSESSLTLSTENLRSSPDMGLSMDSSMSPNLTGYRSISSRSCRTPSAGSLLLSVPSERYGGIRRFSTQPGQRFTVSPADTLFEEQSELILNCGALSTAVLGRIKSFSTSDITMSLGEFDGLNDPSSSFSFQHHSNHGLKSSLSEIGLFSDHIWNPRLDLLNIRSLDATSRSCSTWVIVGDRSLSSVSQLPSPSQAHSLSGTLSPTLNPMDIIFSMNKKVRQMYIRQRLLSTCRTFERLSRSHLDLGNIIKGNKLTGARGSSETSTPSVGDGGGSKRGDGSGREEDQEGPLLVNNCSSNINKSIDVLETSSSVITNHESNASIELFSNIPTNISNNNTFKIPTKIQNAEKTTTKAAQSNLDINSNYNAEKKSAVDKPVIIENDINDENCITGKVDCPSTSSAFKLQDRLASTPLDLLQLQNDLFSLSVRDIELQKGKPLTKYERNMMIFNWLQNLDQEEPN